MLLNAIDRLIDGYQRYRTGYYRENRERLVELARVGQSPRVAMVACCDSRVDPAVITDSNPGELFVIRNVANLVPPCEGEGTWHGTSAALEFAVCGLGVEHLVVMGHARCGGILSLLDPQAAPQGNSFITSWMRIASEAREHTLARIDLATPEDKAFACELEGIRISLANLRTFPWIHERLEGGSLALHGWHYDILSGTLLGLDPDGESFSPLGTDA